MGVSALMWHGLSGMENVASGVDATPFLTRPVLLYSGG